MLIAMLCAAPAMASPFDVEQASRLWLDSVGGAARARSDAYFEGGYWLLLWGALFTIAVDALILRLRLTVWLRDWASARTRRVWLQDWLTGAGYVAFAMVLTLPWQFYTGFLREWQYGLSNQSVPGWLAEAAAAIALALAVLPLLVVFVYSAIRRFPRYWWLAGGIVYTGVMAGLMLVAPVFINPLLNTYSELPEGTLREKIEAMAADHGVPADHILVYDASRQTSRISANVSGLGPTVRISLNDNLLERTSEAEVLSVMGHELGHYVMGHSLRLSLGFGLLAGGGPFFAGRNSKRLSPPFGPRAGVPGSARSRPAGRA
ncbi:MAG TPA: M48 family metalloprotease, partial [Novosphingobium sp.]|nr:M48 family metalloprotease [Novosphingobium sp.]